MRRGVILAAVMALAGAAPAHAVTVEHHRLAVSSPDEFGQAVSLDVDVYVPDGAAPAGGRPLAVVFHGGGSNKDNGFDAGHAKTLAERGMVAVIYSARGHGGSDGQTAVSGPKEMRDAYDVMAWAVRRPKLAIDRERILLWGDSQGGLHVNGVTFHADDKTLNPLGLRPAVIAPANTPDIVQNALAPEGVVKLTFGAGLIQTYVVGASANMQPVLWKWIAWQAATDSLAAPSCPDGEADTLTSPTAVDLAWRSIGCHIEAVTQPLIWAQALDDQLFPPEMAIAMWRRAPAHDRSVLYLSVGGHATPAADPAIEADELAARLQFVEATLSGSPHGLPPVTYWRRDPAVDVPADSYRWPKDAWTRHTAQNWPPPGANRARLALGADGTLGAKRPAAGRRPLVPAHIDVANDPVAQAGASSTPLGTRPLPRDIPPTDARGLLARFTTKPLRAARELAGTPILRADWKMAGAASQVAAKLFAITPDGRRTFLTRGIAGLRGNAPGETRAFRISLTPAAVKLGKGTRLELWVSAGDPTFYKPWLGDAGGVLGVGRGARLSVPWRTLG